MLVAAIYHKNSKTIIPGTASCNSADSVLLFLKTAGYIESGWNAAVKDGYSIEFFEIKGPLPKKY